MIVTPQCSEVNLGTGSKTRPGLAPIYSANRRLYARVYACPEILTCYGEPFLLFFLWVRARTRRFLRKQTYLTDGSTTRHFSGDYECGSLQRAYEGVSFVPLFC